MPKVSDAYLDARRAEILDAAFACFARNGFHETTIQDIAREAQLSHGAIYRYFPSKDAIIKASSARDRVAREARFRAAEAGSTPIDVLDRLFSAYIARQASPEGRAHRQHRVQVFSEGVRNPAVTAEVRETWADVLSRIAAIVRTGQEHGEIDPGFDPHAVARVLAAAHDGLMIHGALDPAIDVPACLQVFRALLRRGLASPAERPKEAVDDHQRALRPQPA